MSCTTNKFVINKGMNNEFILTIKKNNSTLPIIIDPTDTFVAKLYLLEDKSEAISIDNSGTPNDDGNITVYDENNGQIKLTLNDTAVNSLISERGDKVDDYYLIPTYRLAIDCVTVDNGTFVAKQPEVYVEE